MLTFDKYTTLELLRLILATTLDEKLMVQTWRLFRSVHKGPLFAVPTTLTDRKHAAELNGFEGSLVCLRPQSCSSLAAAP